MKISSFRRGARSVAVITTLLLLGGCATFSEDGGFGSVQGEVRDKLGKEVRWNRDDAGRASARAEVAKLIESPLDAERSMQIALLANPRLQAEFANLGISEADLVQAGRIPNPGFSFGKTTGGGAQEIERGLHFSLMSVLTIPLRVGIETRRFEAARLAAARAAVEVALEARGAFFEAVAAKQSVEYFREVLESADTSRELMKRMRRVGNASKLDLAREQLFHAEALTSLARATRQEHAAREALIRKLGLWGEQTGFGLPARLPELPDAPRDLADVERAAMEQRLDIREARHSLDRIAADLDLTEATRFVNVLEVGPAQVRERGEAIRDGYEISLEIPIFDWGSARVARAEAVYMQAAERLRATAIDARSQVRQAYVDYRSAYDVAKHYRDEIVPLRKRISDEQLLRYNGMLIGVFELIADAREQVAAVSAYVDALREFWVAETALDTALLSGGAPMMSAGTAAMPGGAGAADH